MRTLLLNSDAQPVSFYPLSQIPWQEAVKLIYLDQVQVISNYEGKVLRSPSITIPVPSVVMRKEYAKPPRVVAYSAPAVFLRDLYTCQYCEGFLPDKLTQDHVVPRSFGGPLGWDNIVAACFDCNNRRGNDLKYKPRIAPYRPTYWELVEKRKRFPLEIPHASWVPYLNWPEDKIMLCEPIDDGEFSLAA